MVNRRLFLNIISYALMLTGAVLFSASLCSIEKIWSFPETLDENTGGARTKARKTSADWLPVRSDYKSGAMILKIPKLSLEVHVMDGTGENMLKKGPGLYENSDLPVNENSNVSIAAHRDIYKAWFKNINCLEPGDSIILVFNGESFCYKVSRVCVTDKKDWDITRPLGYNAVTLTSCYPHYTSRKRIVVRGILHKREME